MIQLAMIQRSGAANGPDAKLLSVCDSCYKGSWHASPRLCLCALCVRLGAQQRSVVLGWGGGVSDAGSIHATFILTEKAQTSSILILLQATEPVHVVQPTSDPPRLFPPFEPA